MLDRIQVLVPCSGTIQSPGMRAGKRGPGNKVINRGNKPLECFSVPRCKTMA